MSKPKFDMNKNEMLAFNDDCEEAARCCPQFQNWTIEDRVILLGEISAKKLVKHWMDCDVLFKSGYKKELSESAKDVFRRYKEYKAAKIILVKDEKSEMKLKDSEWYWVRYDALGKNNEAVALYKADVDCFYSYEFAGIPTRHLKVLRSA